MKTAIIILNYNSENDTIRYVNEIKNFKCIDTIVVVDNCSSNSNSLEKLYELKNEKVHIIQAPKNGGYSYGNNFGIKYLNSLNEKYEYIIISNPDISIEEIAIEKCIKELEENNSVAIVAPRMYNVNQNPIRRSSWKIRRPSIDMANSTRLMQCIFYPVFKSGEYTKEQFKQEKLKVEAISGAFFVAKYDILEKVRIF